MNKRKNRANLFENDYEDLIYTTDEFIETPKTKNKIDRKAKVQTKQTSKTTSSKQTSSTNTVEIISSKQVPCQCNKCHRPVQGDLINYLFCPSTERGVPFVQYTCTNCGHSGNRSVLAKSMPIKDFERFYFSS